MTTSLVLLAPVPDLELLDELLERLGWGRNNLLAVLAPNATHTPTHRGLRASVSEIAAKALENALHDDTALAVRVILDVRPDAQRHGHFEAVLEAASLVRLSPPEQD